MRFLLRRCTVSLAGLTNALLAGCIGMQSNPALSGFAARRSAVKTATNSDLLYVSNSGNGTVTVYRLQQRNLVATLTGFERPKGECVDSDGDVFITDRLAENVVEYAHGATQPMAVISDSGFQDYACSVDPTTGDLAVANSYQRDGNAGLIAIYAHATGPPKLYRIDHAPNPQTCAYDNRGDLLVASDYLHAMKQFVAFAYLPKNHKHFVRLDLSISGLQPGGTYNVHAAQPSSALYWKHPAGGDSVASITDALNQPYGVVVSSASTR